MFFAPVRDIDVLFFFGASQNIMTLVLFKCFQIAFICFYWPGQHAILGACETQPVGHSANYANHEKLCELLRIYETMFYSSSTHYKINCPCFTAGQSITESTVHVLHKDNHPTLKLA